MRTLIALGILGLAIGNAGAAGAEPVKAPPAFAKKPKVEAKGAGFAVSFAADRPCDAAVAVLDKDGRVVRHLAAGLLGPKAPAPFARDVLEQTVEWDGRDDDNLPVAPAGCSVRVSLGLSPELDRVIGGNPYRLGGVRALAAGPKGEVFVFHAFGTLHPSDNTAQCAVFDRGGKYLRTVLPYPANLKEEDLKGLRRLELPDGTRVPFIYQPETRSLVPGAGELPAERAVVTADGRVAFVGVQELGRYANAGRASLTVIRADGSAPAPVLGAALAEGNRSGASLALSPDDRKLYAAGLEDKKLGHAVWRLGWDSARPEVFAGKPGEAGKDDAHFNDPGSVAVDAAGNVYVADRGNGRVVVLDPAGKRLAALAVEKPERVEVHGGSGALYVLGGAHREMLWKFSGWKWAEGKVLEEPRKVSELRLPYFGKEDFAPVMALDSSAEPAVLWVGNGHGMHFARYCLLRIEDRGGAFGDAEELTAREPERLGLGAVTLLELDRRTERLYVGSRGLDWCLGGRNGKPIWFKRPDLGGSGVTAGLGPDGFIYHYWDYPSATLSRFTPEGLAVPFPGLGTNRLAGLGSPRLRGRGVTADRRGNIYVLQQTGKDGPGDAEDANALFRYGPDGVRKGGKLVDSELRSLNSVRVDPRGSIYLAVGLRPGSDLLPPGLDGVVPADKKLPEAVGGVNPYPLMYGSIVKFGAAGGVIRKGAGGEKCNFGFGNGTEVKGAEWIFPGASPVPSWRTPGSPDICLCESPRFDVDGFGRSFFPDAGRFRVGIVDTAGNEIGWFGSYGNQDSAGKDSLISEPAIPLCWPHAVAVGDEAVYVGDRLNRRVLRVKLKYAAEETVKLP